MALISKSYLQCTNCDQDYNQTDRVPRILPCLHGCCEKCLLEIKSSDHIKCPTCSERHLLTNGEVSTFPVDDSRGSLITYSKVQTKNTELLCDECSSQKKAVSRCAECVQFLCKECTDAHKRTKVTKTHRVMTLDELKYASLDDYQQLPCCSKSGHGNQPFTFYCSTDTCDRPLCALCVVEEQHESRGHDIRNIQDVSMETKENIKSLISDMKHQQLAITDSVRSVEDTSGRLETVQRNLTEEIDAAFDKCQMLLDHRRQELKRNVQSSLDRKKRRLERQMDLLKSHKINAEDAAEFANCLFSFSSAKDIVLFRKMTLDRLRLLVGRKMTVTSQVDAGLKFHGANTGDDFEQYVKRMGELSIPTDRCYDVTTRDVTIGQEDICVYINVIDDDDFNTEGANDIRVVVQGPDNKVTSLAVIDCTSTEGCYKATFIGHRVGRHVAHIYVNGVDLHTEGYTFNALNLQRSSRQGNVQRMQNASTPSVASGRITRASQVMVVSNITCAEFEFDASVCHSNVEIYGEKKVMQSKHATKETSLYKTIESGRLINYRGTLGTKPLNRHDQCYFEVAIQFRVLKLIRQTLVFEIGVSKLEFVDQHYTIDCHPYAWSVSARGCHICGKVCLQTWHNCQLLSHNAISPRTPTPANTVIRLHYGFLLDVTRRHLIVIDVKNCKMVFKFTNLVISEYSDPLWPVFGIYNPEQVLVSMQLLSGKDINNIPIEAIEALSR